MILTNETVDEHRVLVLAPVGRDGTLAQRVLGTADIQAKLCANLDELLLELARGAGAALAADEALPNDAVARIAEVLSAQPPWSDFPIIVLTTREASAGQNRRALERLIGLGNITALERPFHVDTLVSAVRAALRARRRQYEGRRAFAAQERAVRQRDEFLALLGHELRNPLGAISNATALLHRIAEPDPRASRPIQVLTRQTAHLTRLVDELLDVARVTSGKITLARTMVDLRSVARDVAESHVRSARSRNVEIGLELGDDPITIFGDPVRLEQVFANILTNAIKYTPAGGSVRVSVTKEAAEARVVVADTGVGIGPDVLPFIFEPFTQAQRTLDRAQGGMGLGLHLVQVLAQLHGGSVHATSDGLGKGSTFTICLPLASVDLPAGRIDDQRPCVTADAQPGRPAHILIVEDASDIRNTLKDLLELLGYRVDVAADGKEGIELGLALRPDVALIDIGLPFTDGYEVARQLRGRLGNVVRLIAVTGYGQPADRARALAAGFDEHLTKPVAFPRLEALLAAQDANVVAAVR